MNTQRQPGPLLRCLAALRGAIRWPRRVGAASQPLLSSDSPASDGFPGHPRDMAMGGQRAISALQIKEPFAETADEPAIQPRLRTLEEVRADLAALRERTRTLHAQAQAQRAASFAPTDFMDFADARTAPADNPASGFAPTDFLDFGALNLQPGR